MLLQSERMHKVNKKVCKSCLQDLAQKALVYSVFGIKYSALWCWQEGYAGHPAWAEQPVYLTFVNNLELGSKGLNAQYIWNWEWIKDLKDPEFHRNPVYILVLWQGKKDTPQKTMKPVEDTCELI